MLLRIQSRFFPRHVPTAWLLSGAAVEFAINAWTLGFVLRMRACDSPGRFRAFLVSLQVVLIALLVAFATAVLLKRPRAASWVAAAYFFVGLVSTATMRAWIHRLPGGRRCGDDVSPVEFAAVDAVNWLAIVGVVVKIVGLLVSLWTATT